MRLKDRIRYEWPRYNLGRSSLRIPLKFRLKGMFILNIYSSFINKWDSAPPMILEAAEKVKELQLQAQSRSIRKKYDKLSIDSLINSIKIEVGSFPDRRPW